MGLLSWLGFGKKAPEFNLADHWVKCRGHIQRMRLAAVHVRSDLRQAEFAADVERLGEAYEDLVRELEKNPLDIMTTGAVEGNLRDLSEGIQTLVITCKRRGLNDETLPEIERNRARFREILEKVDRDLSQIAADRRMDRQVRMEALLRVIVPGKNKKSS